MKPLLYGFGEAWKYVQDALRVPLGLLSDLSTGIETLSDKTGIARGKIVAFGGYISALLFPFTRTITLVGTALAVLEDFTAFLSGRGSAIGKFLKSFEESNPVEYKKTVEAVKEAFDSISEVVKTILEGWRMIFELLGNDDLMSGALGVLRTVASEIRAAADAVLLLTGKKDAKEVATFNRDGGVVDYVVRGIASAVAKPTTMTEEAKQTLVTRQEIATLLHRMRDVEFRERRISSMTEQQRADFEAERAWVRTQEAYIENTFNIQIDGSQDPNRVANEIMRIQKEMQQKSLQAVRDKSAGVSE